MQLHLWKLAWGCRSGPESRKVDSIVCRFRAESPSRPRAPRQNGTANVKRRVRVFTQHFGTPLSAQGVFASAGNHPGQAPAHPEGVLHWGCPPCSAHCVDAFGGRRRMAQPRTVECLWEERNCIDCTGMVCVGLVPAVCDCAGHFAAQGIDELIQQLIFHFRKLLT